MSETEGSVPAVNGPGPNPKIAPRSRNPSGGHHVNVIDLIAAPRRGVLAPQAQ